MYLSIYLFLCLSSDLQVHPQRDAGAGDDLGQEPRAPAALHYADDGHHAQTGKQLVLHDLLRKVK